MNKILEKIIEPDDIYVGSFFKLKVRIEPQEELKSLTFEELRLFTFKEAKEKFTFDTLKGVKNGKN